MLMVAGCSQSQPRYRMEATTKIYALRMEGAAQSLPKEYESISEAFEAGDRFLQGNKVEEADLFYLLALRKAELLEQTLKQEKILREEVRKNAEEERRQAERQQALEALKNQLAEEKRKVQREAGIKIEKALPVREKDREVRTLPQYHTVKRGETLPQIAAQPDVYGEAGLWPLLYRANRDQIRDPKRIWPGQVLRIPRNASKEDLAEARKYAQERHLP